MQVHLARQYSISRLQPNIGHATKKGFASRGTDKLRSHSSLAFLRDGRILQEIRRFLVLSPRDPSVGVFRRPGRRRIGRIVGVIYLSCIFAVVLILHINVFDKLVVRGVFRAVFCAFNGDVFDIIFFLSSNILFRPGFSVVSWPSITSPFLNGTIPVGDRNMKYSCVFYPCRNLMPVQNANCNTVSARVRAPNNSD